MKQETKTGWAALVVGVIFAVGLGISGMTQPKKVIGFLDLFGNWDPSLIFVMAGAVAVHLVTYRLIRRRSSPVLEKKWHVPTKTNIGTPLVLGSFLFGIGWGLAGYCPGPAVTSLASFEVKPFVFVIAMLVGMFGFKVLDKKLKIQR